MPFHIVSYISHLALFEAFSSIAEVEKKIWIDWFKQEKQRK